MSIISNHQGEFSKAIEHFKLEIVALKTGRANPAMLDGILVEAYGVLNPISQIATVSLSDARGLAIQPWDKGLLKEIEKAIAESDLQLSPVNDGERIRLNMPPLTEETRKEAVKSLGHKAEDAKISVRLLRDKIKEEVLEAEKNKEFGEDEKFRLLEELDKVVGKHNEEIKALADKKEAEIMTV